ncbi:hypothetical protein EG68_06485 [Paragonimus skrjabini miyazakii]|uniref:POU domain protein n=1 Tax=Paragonimus skrjabini miyazakii TaxID=59628 RepID=A0A8S9YUN4_9TREM|nr:hypothetical protein EG68_06485 [Paragonimus skrjabini miyazakii]
MDNTDCKVANHNTGMLIEHSSGISSANSLRKDHKNYCCESTQCECDHFLRSNAHLSASPRASGDQEYSCQVSSTQSYHNNVAEYPDYVGASRHNLNSIPQRYGSHSNCDLIAFTLPSNVLYSMANQEVHSCPLSKLTPTTCNACLQQDSRTLHYITNVSDSNLSSRLNALSGTCMNEWKTCSLNNFSNARPHTTRHPQDDTISSRMATESVNSVEVNNVRFRSNSETTRFSSSTSGSSQSQLHPQYSPYWSLEHSHPVYSESVNEQDHLCRPIYRPPSDQPVTMRLEYFPPSPNDNTSGNKTAVANSHTVQGVAHTQLIGSATLGDADTIEEGVNMTHLNMSMINTSGQLPAMFTDDCCHLNPPITRCRTETRCTSDNRISNARIQRQFSDFPGVSTTMSVSDVSQCLPTHSTPGSPRQVYYDELSNNHPSSLQDYSKFYQSFGLLSAFTQLLLPKPVSCLEDPFNTKMTEPSKLEHSIDRPMSPTATSILGPVRSQPTAGQQHQRNKTIMDEQLYVMLNPGLPDEVSGDYGCQAEDYNCLGENNDLITLRAFAGKFKQRRMKLGITQAEVGRALGRLKLGGFGCLSQSTICRFESLTLSQNNMLVLKPILQTWLDQVEQLRYSVLRNSDGTCYTTDGSGFQDFMGADRRRRRTSITDPEKRMLEAYFRAQPKPTAEELGAIANRIKLRKNVVRVWFCNQRQKHKRLHLKQYASNSTM